MDGRGCSFVVLALALGLCGCVPNQNKITSLEKPSPETFEASEPKSMNPFAEAPKREPKLELALALMCEQKATSLQDVPEQHFRQLDEARKMYQEILNYDGKNIDAFRGLTRIYIVQRDFNRANATIQKASELHPKNVQIYGDWAIVYSKQNDFSGAIQKLNKAREIDPENQEIMKALGVNLVCAGQVDQGIDILSRARGRAAAHYYVACLYKRTNRPDEARRHVQMALEANPGFNDARALLTELDRRTQPQTAPPSNVGLQFVSDENP